MLAFKKVFFLIFVVILIIVAVVNSVLVYNKYKGKEKIVAKIYNINKVKYEYHVGSGLDRESFIVTDYNVDYSFKYNGDVKTDSFRGNMLFRKGNNLTIYYDKKTDTSVVFIFPMTIVYMLILILFYLPCLLWVILKKEDIETLYRINPGLPFFFQFVMIVMVYCSHIVDKNPTYLLLFFFMFVSISCAHQTYMLVVKKRDRVKEILESKNY